MSLPIVSSCFHKDCKYHSISIDPTPPHAKQQLFDKVGELAVSLPHPQSGRLHYCLEVSALIGGEWQWQWLETNKDALVLSIFHPGSTVQTNKQTTPTLFKHFLAVTIKLDQGDKGFMQGWPPLRSATSLNLQKKLSLCSLIIRLWCLQFCPHAVHQTLDSFILPCFWFGRNLWLSPTRKLKHKEHQLPWTLALGSKCPKGSQCDINRARS